MTSRRISPSCGRILSARADPGLRRGRLWCPFRLQFYCNGHSWLARQLTVAGVGFTLADNAFLRIDDWERAQTLADTLSPDHLHRILKKCDVTIPSYRTLALPAPRVTRLPQLGGIGEVAGDKSAAVA
jgi:hypothetical protein